MRLMILLLAASLGALSLALAEEEPTSSPEPAAADPTVSITTQKNASAAEKKQTAAALKSDSPKPKKNPSPTPAKPAASATPEAKKANAPNIETTLKEMENKWQASVVSHDTSVPQAMLADDYKGVSSRGKILNKSGLLAELKKDTDVYKSATNGKLDVRVYGGQFAVVIGISTEIGKDKDGKEFDRSFRWTDTWVARNGTWQCVASQSLLIPK